MARVAMVTRTIKSTTAEVLVANLETEQVFTKSITVAGTHKSEKTLLKALEQSIDTTEKIMTVKSTTVNENLYGMEEQKFLQLAEVLPARGTKEVE